MRGIGGLESGGLRFLYTRVLLATRISYIVATIYFVTVAGLWFYLFDVTYLYPIVPLIFALTWLRRAVKLSRRVRRVRFLLYHALVMGMDEHSLGLGGVPRRPTDTYVPPLPLQDDEDDDDGDEASRCLQTARSDESSARSAGQAGGAVGDNDGDDIPIAIVDAAAPPR